eukprot:CAMPEP_0181127490 /NCGR_PEP_ID=MMETSP1071-20121207/28227_1 /TAXON_ID=35127 /ORGANISM="Thalassiosira sp., Strain NH16" /LENGTH=82 /DNA_ID=CAMNT_0023213235 /DNA_START=297 /DNA_END=541 /DNA_ORIENTATION=+
MRNGGSGGPSPQSQAPLPSTDPKVSEKENEEDWVAEFRATNYSFNPFVAFNVQISKNKNLEKDRLQKKKKKKRGSTTAHAKP